MVWRTALGLSSSLALSLTVFECVKGVHLEPPIVESWDALWRLSAATAGVIFASCIGAAIIGGMIATFVGLQREEGCCAGALAVALPWGLYLGGVEISWDHDAYGLWFAFGIPVAFTVVSWLMRGIPKPAGSLLRNYWPAIGPSAMLVLAVQSQFHKRVLLGGASILVGALLIGAVIRRWPRVGTGFSNSALIVLAALALVSDVTPDLARRSAVTRTAAVVGPPVVILTVDTLRRDALSLYGSGTPTPAFDALAADGIIFDRAYSTAPWTYPSFSSIMSGVTPWAHGVRLSSDRLSAEAPVLARILSERGYETASIGSNGMLTPSGPGRAITRSFDDAYFYPRTLRPLTRGRSFLSPATLGLSASTTDIGRYGEEWVRRHSDAPFLLWLHFFDPHEPYRFVEEFPPAREPPAGLRRKYGDDLSLDMRTGEHDAGLAEWARTLYQSEVRLVDQAVGRFLATLEDEGLYDTALIIFTADHGEEFAEHNAFFHGQSLYNELVRVPLVVKLPDSTENGRVEQPVSNVALIPTVLDTLGISFDPGHYSARPLREAWEESGDDRPAPAVYMTGVNVGDPAQAVVWEDYKFIAWQNRNHEELYDLAADSGEEYNLVQRLPEQAAIGRALLAEHAQAEAKRAAARGLEAAESRPLTPVERNILRGLGYL